MTFNKTSELFESNYFRNVNTIFRYRRNAERRSKNNANDDEKTSTHRIKKRDTLRNGNFNFQDEICITTLKYYLKTKLNSSHFNQKEPL
jgi:hypothetical protein